MELDLMSREETDRLAELEAVIKKDMKGFIRVGMALKEIKDKRLYRSKYTTWKDYLKGEWDISRAYGDRYIDAFEVIENLNSSFRKSAPIGALLDEDGPDQNVHHGGHSEEDSDAFEFPFPKNEAQTRPLTLLKPEQQPEAWKMAVRMSGYKVTALAVTKVVQEILESQLEDDKNGIQQTIIKEVTVPDDFSSQFTRLLEILDMHRKSGWKEFNRKKALEFIKSIEEYLNS